METQRPLVEFLSNRWPGASLVAVFLAGTVAIVVAMLTDHADQVTGIITFAGVAAAGVITLYRLDTNRDDVTQRIKEAKTEVVVNQTAAETKIDAAKKTAEVAAIKVEKARQETVDMLSDQNQVLQEIHKQTNGEGPIAELVAKVDKLVEKVDSHGRILESLTRKP